MSIFDNGGNRPAFADIIAPMTTETFFAEYYDRKPVHIPGGADKFAGLMDWDILTRLLNKTAIWSSRSLMLMADRQPVPARAYCEDVEDRAGHPVLQPVPSKVMEFLRQGASLVANDIDTLTPELSAVADAFEAAYDGKTQVNLYCSWKQRQAFNSHFDTHDVFALHVEGEKVWRVYKTRMPHPIRHPRHQNDAYGEAAHEQQRGEVLMEVKMTPGDILYLPRGWYHDALAASGGTVHMAFGVTSVIGLDAIGALSDFAVEDEAFRLNLPRSAQGPEALSSALAELGDKLQALSRNPRLLAAIQAHQAGFRNNRMGFDLPVETAEKRFVRTGPGFKVVRQGGRAALVGPRGAVPIPPGREKIVEWVVGRPGFDRGDFLDAHGSVATADLDRLLAELIGMGVLRQEN
ncbi:MAG: cupin domain-containing protein [Alphaproteobacteria bacterium]|nr:cupin domain-containing protein [Alphaproteobacteria bacterium]